MRRPSLFSLVSQNPFFPGAMAHIRGQMIQRTVSSLKTSENLDSFSMYHTFETRDPSFKLFSLHANENQDTKPLDFIVRKDY